MSHIIENGSGVAFAQTYIEPTFVTAYLLDRNRTGENGWPTVGLETDVEDAATIAAADYIENKFREVFNGSKEFRDISLARATLTFQSNPVATETVTLGSTGGDGSGVYTFVAVLAAPGDVLLGANGAESIANLIAAINLDVDSSGTAYEATTVENDDASVTQFYLNQLVAFAKTAGTAGNTVATTATAGGWNFVTLRGGADFPYPQPLSFPRANLFDRDGIPVIGIPRRLLFAAAEASVRARVVDPVTSLPVPLIPDPTYDPLGGTVTGLREKVGPIETATTYLAGSTGGGAGIPSYPAADRLLRDYVRRGGVVIR